MTATLDLHLSDAQAPVALETPTIWGLDPTQLHDHFWAARGVSVVRLGERTEIPRDAELYLLTDARTLVVFRLAPLIDTLSWVKPGVIFLRLLWRKDEDYRETVVTDADGRFVRFRRIYGGAAPQLSRVALTRNPRIAAVWQGATDPRGAWRELRRQSRAVCREARTIRGRAYDRSCDRELARFVTELVGLWSYPRATVAKILKAGAGVWVHELAKFPEDVRFIGAAWVGAGRRIESGATVVGPAVLWDDPAHRPTTTAVPWSELEPIQGLVNSRRGADPPKRPGLFGKRLFDILFAAIVLLFTLPIYPLVILAIWIEDGRPFFFLHRRQTRGGREFPCIKFRSMRKDADRIKAQLAKANQADGPQFFVREDPRLTKVGRIIRKANIDELPQFINVLLGDMAVVGPRPSPSAENQYCPSWRDARLSVRAGITGLWQVSRTRRPGLDFQEWIKYDLEYVLHLSWRMDLRIIFRTIAIVLRG
jgi:lipopolysaccharide/colanic/teichoic acid biosynthesis glycosyltransferase